MHAGCALRTFCTRFDPGLDQVPEKLLRAGSWIAALSWLPTPSDEIIVGRVFVQKSQVASAISARVL
jgi:hypothetical protein